MEKEKVEGLDFPVEDIVRDVSRENGRSGAEVDAVLRVLNDNWIVTAGQWIRAKDEKIEGLPAVFRADMNARIDRMVLGSKKNDDDGPTIEDLETKPEWNADEDDLLENALVKELAGHFDAGASQHTLTKIFINDISSYSTANQTIDFDLGVHCHFFNKALIGLKNVEPPINKAWNQDCEFPELEFVGAKDVQGHLCVETNGSHYVRE
jgi:hypothetical protein